MNCYKGGATIPEGNAFCGNCGAAAPIVPSPDETPEPENGGGNGRGRFLKSPGKKAKSYAAIATALMVFPASICGVIDLLFHANDGWSLYVIGGLLVAWMVSVFPVLSITPAPVTALLSFFSIMTYVLLLVGKEGFTERFFQVGLPLMVLMAIFVAVDSALASAGKLKGLHMISVVSLETVIYMVVAEIAFDLQKRGVIDLRWSLIVACFFISAIAIAEAVSYVWKINKK